MKKKINVSKLNKKRGSELAETVLIIAISIVVVVSIFYPQIIKLFNNSMANLSNWFNAAISQIGIV